MMWKIIGRAALSGIRGQGVVQKSGLGSGSRRWLSGSGFSPLSPMSLEEVMKKDMITNESPDRLKTIWTEYHNTKATSVGYVISDEENQKMIERLKESPLFIHPVFKDETGDTHIIMLSQMQEKYIMFTYLEEYKQNPEAATQWASLKVFDDFASSKGLALVRGDLSPQLTRAEGDILTRSMLHVYLDDTAYAQHVKTFNNAPEQFDFGAYIAFMKEEALSGVER